MAKKPTKAKAETAAPVEPQIAYKGFNSDLACHPGGGQLVQYGIGETTRHDGDVVACSSGIHVCTNPFDVWRYYPPVKGNRFGEVAYAGKVATHEGDSKLAVEEITINVELSLPAFIKAGVSFLFKRADAEKKVSASNRSTSATSGNRSTSATSGFGSTSATSGDYSTSATSGNRSTSATSGFGSTSAIASGANSIALAAGMASKAKAAAGSAIVVAEYDDTGKLLGVHAAMVGRDGIKPDTLYRAEGGKLVEA